MLSGYCLGLDFSWNLDSRDLMLKLEVEIEVVWDGCLIGLS